ncbi:MAG: HAMP domain-containing sensor histidine kinase [Henriciella sp.]|nr:HAMP domain-containing sensor histidine kinase [Henriciella sp.]
MKAPKTLQFRFGRLSLAQRILIGALIWSAVIVIGGVVALTAVYRSQALSLLEDELNGTLITLSRALDVMPDGRVADVPERLPPDPRFATPLSGRYWMVIAVDDQGEIVNDIRSRSLFDENLPFPDNLREDALNRQGEIVRGDAIGPYGEPIRTLVQSVIIPNRDNPILLVVSADRTTTDDGADRLRTILLIAMLSLAGGTLLAMALGLRYALRPLDRIQSDIADVREGRSAALEGDYPVEVQPLSEELNKLLEHNRAVVSRARTHVGNLAHALKTPLAVLRNEATGDDQLNQVVRRQTEAMRSNVDHYLKRAQAAARAETLGTRTDLANALAGLSRIMNKLFAGEGKHVSVSVDEVIMVRAEQQDIEEMAGNLMDNACKWAKRRIEVTTETGNNGLVMIHIDDDGPGLTVEERTEALKRGVRLDEAAPGTGLGLSIVKDIAEMNGGRLELSDSPLGGLRATLSLRRAA